jgi:lipopolysaccharide transport system permease protein
MSADIAAQSNASADNDADVWVVRPHRGTLPGYLGETWRYRRLFSFLTTYAIRNMYSSAILGMGWLFIRPIIAALMATFIFNGVFKVSTAPVPYLLFVLTSLSLWLMFQRTLAFGTKSIQRNGRLLRQFYFPRIIAHVTAITPVFVEFGIVLFAAAVAGVYFAISGVDAVDFGLHNLGALLAIAMVLLFVIGITCVTSPLNAIARDVWYTMRYVMMPLTVLTPVYFPRAMLPEPWKEYILLNPLTPIVELYRWSIFHDQPMRWDALALSGGVILVTLLLGLLFFVSWEPKTLDSRA